MPKMSLYYIRVLHENKVFFEEHFKVMIRPLSIIAAHCKKKVFYSQFFLLLVFFIICCLFYSVIFLKKQKSEVFYVF